MTKLIREQTDVKRSQVYEDYEEEYVCIPRYLDLEEKDFCCKEMYKNLLGEDDGRCESHLRYQPKFREYFVDIRDEFGGAIYLIKHCPWCGKKFPSPLRNKFFDTLEKEYNIETDIGECQQREDISPKSLRAMSDERKESFKL
jgi:hypothetical protein